MAARHRCSQLQRATLGNSHGSFAHLKPVAVNPTNSNDSARFVTITFDDGLIEGARKAVNILDEFKLSATFYLVTGWIKPRWLPWTRDRWNRGLDHGSWRDWREIQKRGHDIGSHTVTHLNAGGKIARHIPTFLRWELAQSYSQLRRHLGRAPTSISMPWNTPAERLEPVVRRIYAACRLGSETLRTNDLAQVNWHRLQSWAPDPNISADDVVDHIRATPAGHWLILQFHSLDGEGYRPVTSKTFRDVLRGLMATPDLRYITVDEMVRQARRPDAVPRRFPHRSERRICLVTSEQISTNPRLVKEADALSKAGFDVRVVACQWMDWPREEDAKLLASRNWRCQIINYSRESSPKLFWSSRFRHYSIRHFFAPLLSGDKMIPRALGRVVPEMMRAAASEPADLFIGHNLAGLPAAVLAAGKQGARAAFDAEDLHSRMWLKEFGPTAIARLAERAERRFLPRCAYITAAAPLIAQAYARRYELPLPETILNVFPLADRPAQFRPHDPSAPLTLYWFSQVIGARRGLEDIIRAIALSGSKDIQLHLRGQWQGGYEDELRAWVHDARLRQEQIVSHALGSPDDMIRLSGEYDVGLALEQPVSENRDICLTNKICTYLLAGNAVIASGTRGQRHFMNQIPGVGLCYEIDDVQTVAEQLHKWEQDRDSLERARRRAWQFGEENYNWDIEQKKLLAMVEQTMAVRPAAK
jgi:peptidoglycan/xylan/chitin deacetylase (PgdA/CDA1 family)/glycosyltransferase involved in cell wall biosynthesis